MNKSNSEMQNEDVFFNIVIPTKNRLKTLEFSLKTALNQHYENYTIIISDNNSKDGTFEFINSLDSTKIEYYNTGKTLSMSSNFEFALSKISRGYVIIIGDDDGLLPDALYNLNLIIKKERPLAISSKTIIYTWPGDVTPPNLLLVPPMHSGYTLEHSKSSIKRVMSGKIDYNFLPTLYTGGVIHHALIEKARDRRGTFYHSLTPDAYSAFAITSVVDNFIRCNSPFAIMGASRFSNGQSSFGLNTNKSPAEDFFKTNNIPFYHSLGNGQIKSLQIITYEAYLQSSFLRTKTPDIKRERQFEISIIKSKDKTNKLEIIKYLNKYCDYSPPKNILNTAVIYLSKIKYKIFLLSDRVSKFIIWDTIPITENITNVYDVTKILWPRHIPIILKIKYKIIKLTKKMVNEK